jgi:hypothetical protein
VWKVLRRDFEAKIAGRTGVRTARLYFGGIRIEGVEDLLDLAASVA